VRILDPFTGTGTFMARLFDLGLIAEEDLDRKYREELFANDIVLLAYYVASVNIENAYQQASSSEDYLSFPGLCLTDTFAMDRPDEHNQFFEENSKRRTRQQQSPSEAPIQVIIGNPPYSAGQKNENDNAKNVKYDTLDARIRSTYAEHSTATNLNSLYDSYIRAIRWASDRIEGEGVVGFITNGSWLRGMASDGMRKCLAAEFSSLYIFDLRGDGRTTAEKQRKDGGKIFGQSTRTPVAITFFIKTKQKLDEITSFDNLFNVPWQELTPDKYHDWLDQRDQSFYQFIKIADKKSPDSTLYQQYYSMGIKTNRDAWVLNHHPEKLTRHIEKLIATYEQDSTRYQQELALGNKPNIDDFVTADATKIKWDSTLKKHLARNKTITYSPDATILSSYRPFEKRWLYYSRELNNTVCQMPQIFPFSQENNRVIGVTGKGSKGGFSALMTDCVPNLHFMITSQCFPLYWYPRGGGNRIPALSQESLAQVQAKYPQLDQTISHENVFYYIYALFHLPEYKTRYEDNLKKELPRIPFPEKSDSFFQLVKAGKTLGELHVNYDQQPCWSECYTQIKEDSELDDITLYKVHKMKFADKKDKTVIIYNSHITVSGIPSKAYDYQVNGKSAIEWVMDRWRVRVDKTSKIKSDPNDWAIDTAKDPQYILKLLLRVITVSMETMKVVENLSFDWDDDTADLDNVSEDGKIPVMSLYHL